MQDKTTNPTKLPTHSDAVVTAEIADGVLTAMRAQTACEPIIARLEEREPELNRLIREQLNRAMLRAASYIGELRRKVRIAMANEILWAAVAVYEAVQRGYGTLLDPSRLFLDGEAQTKDE